MKQVVAALIVRKNKILICQRTRHQTMPLKWEFPGGKIEPGEKPEQALQRELEEELGIVATIGRKVATIRHDYRDPAATNSQPGPSWTQAPQSNCTSFLWKSSRAKSKTGFSRMSAG